MQILVMNSSTILSNSDFKKMVDSVSIQVNRDFCPAWNLSPIAVTRVSSIPTSMLYDTALVIIYDTPDDNALGYHTRKQDRAFGKVFVQPVLNEGGCILLDLANDQRPTVASVLSHEILEMIADPMVNIWADGPTIAAGSSYSFEVCDPVENDQYVINGVGVSNFVFPSWFDSESTKQPVDFLKKLKKPFTMTKGGYMVVRGKSGAGKAVFASKKASFRQKVRDVHGMGRGILRKAKVATKVRRNRNKKAN